MKKKTGNVAFIDGQNLYMGTTKINKKLGDTEKDSWKIDIKRFREYLTKKFGVEEAYYFLGVINEENQDLYTNLQKNDFLVVFREHSSDMIAKKKGNIDTDLVFHLMKMLYKDKIKNKIVLVAGDGNYKKMVDFLIEEKKFEKVLLPNFKRASSLYKKMTSTYFVDLSQKDIRRKIEYKKEKGTLGS